MELKNCKCYNIILLSSKANIFPQTNKPQKNCAQFRARRGFLLNTQVVLKTFLPPLQGLFLFLNLVPRVSLALHPGLYSAAPFGGLNWKCRMTAPEGLKNTAGGGMKRIARMEPPEQRPNQRPSPSGGNRNILSCKELSSVAGVFAGQLGHLGRAGQWWKAKRVLPMAMCLLQNTQATLPSHVSTHGAVSAAVR